MRNLPSCFDSSALLWSICLLMAIGFADAQVRTWGFSKNAVNEWATAGDTVSLVNQGADTLKFDTAWLETIGPAPHGGVVRFYRGGTYYALGTGLPVWGPNPSALVISPLQSIRLQNFLIDADAPPLAKSAVSTAVGDTLRARLIFQAAAGRGRDTLQVDGWQQTSSLRFLEPSGKPGDAGRNRLFDPLGRRVESLPEGVRAPMRPLLAPK